jgi:peptidoglycan/LPS O-acetylase OafA/YrhL
MHSTRQGPRRLGRRPALDGLRALAVMLVVGIHVGLLAAGYVGVDVFLPLSGFLITALVYEEWERTGGISLRRFYERRVRRLLPALVLLLAGATRRALRVSPPPPENRTSPAGRHLRATGSH